MDHSHTIETVQQAVLHNEHPVPATIVDMFKTMNIHNYAPRSNQVISASPHETTIEHEFELFGTKPFIDKIPQNWFIETPIGDNNQNLLPGLIGVPGAEPKVGDVPIYELYEAEEKEVAEFKFNNETLPMIAAAGAISAVAIYMMMNKPQRRN